MSTFPQIVSNDPVTLLTADQMNELVAWWQQDESDEIVLKNQTTSGGELVFSADREAGEVWVDPTP